MSGDGRGRDASRGLLAWRGLIEAQTKERQRALARARQLAARCEQIEALLLGERERRDGAECTRRGRGELPDFASERLDALLERAIEGAHTKLATAHDADERAHAKLRESWQQTTALDRLLERRAARARDETQRAAQEELDEIAQRRARVAAEAAEAAVAPMENLR